MCPKHQKAGQNTQHFKKYFNYPQTVFETVIDTKYEQQCQTAYSTECDTVVVTQIETVPDKECVVVEEKQCSTVWQNKFDKECRYMLLMNLLFVGLSLIRIFLIKPGDDFVISENCGLH